MPESGFCAFEFRSRAAFSETFYFLLRILGRAAGILRSDDLDLRAMSDFLPFADVWIASDSYECGAICGNRPDLFYFSRRISK